MNLISYQFPEEIKIFFQLNRNSNLDKNQIYALLSNRDVNGVPWYHYTMVFAKAMNLIMASDSLSGLSSQLLSIRDSNEETAFQQRHLASVFLELAKEWQKTPLEAPFQIYDSNGKTFLHYKANFVQFCRACQHRSLEYFIKKLSIKDASGVPLAHYPAIIAKALSHIKNHPEYSLEHFFQFCNILDEHGHSPLAAEENFAQALSFIPNTTLDEFSKALFYKDVHGKSPLHYPHNFQTFIERQQCTVDNLEHILRLINKEGLYTLENFMTLISHLRNVSHKTLVRILALQDDEGFIAFKNPDNFKKYVETLHSHSDVIEVLSLLDKNGRPLIHANENFSLLPLSTYPLHSTIMICAIKDINGCITVQHLQNFQTLLKKELSTNQLLRILGLLDENGRTALHYEHNFRYLLENLLENLLKNPILIDQFHGLLSLCDKGNQQVAICYYPLVLQALEKLPQKTRSTLMCIGVTPGVLLLQTHEALEYFVKNTHLSFDELEPIFSLRNKRGETILHLVPLFQRLLPTLEKMPVSHLIRMFSLRQEQGLPVLNIYEIYHIFINHYKTQHKKLVEILAKLFQEASLPLAIPVFFTPLLQILKDLPTETQIEFFTMKDKYGTPLLFTCALCKDSLPILEKLSEEDFKKITSLTNSKGDSLFHFRKLYNLIYPLASKHTIDLNTFVNEEGVTPPDLLKLRLSPSWLTRRKIAIPLPDSISKEDYKKRIRVLAGNVFTTWKHIKTLLETGKIPSHILYVNNKQYSADDVLKALQSILHLMVMQTAWTGTPRLDEPEKLHLFYCVQLINFEILFRELEKRNIPQEQAGYFVDIAKVVFERRCATAYQLEIEQKRDLILNAGCDLNTSVERAASLTLQATIDVIVGQNFSNDVHAKNQLSYAANLTDQPDPLPPLNISSVDRAQQCLLHFWEPVHFYRVFGEKITHEMAIDWLKLRTPDTYCPNLLKLEKCLKEDEEILFIEMQKHLSRVVPSNTLPNTLPNTFEALASRLKHTAIPSCHTLHLPSANKENILKQTFHETPLFSSFLLNPIIVPNPLFFPSCEEFKDHLSATIKNFERTFQKDTSYPKKLQESRHATIKLLTKIEAIFAFDNLMNEYEIPQNRRKAILEIMQVYCQGIEMLAEQLSDLALVLSPNEAIEIAQDVDFVVELHKLPSIACDDARRCSFITPVICTRGRMLLEILRQEGVQERVQERVSEYSLKTTT